MIKNSIIDVSVIPGDANMDDQVTISDVVSVVNYILNKSTKDFSVIGADVTSDNAISVGDIVGIVNIILNVDANYSLTRNAKRSAIASSSDRLTMADVCAESDNVSIPVSLDNSNVYTALQMDVELPDGATLASATLSGRASSSHAICWQSMADGKVRVVA
jgi:hypothetical protein